MDAGGTPMEHKRLVTAMMNGLAVVAANPHTHSMLLDQLSVSIDLFSVMIVL